MEEIIIAGEKAMMCLYKAKDHNSGLNTPRKTKLMNNFFKVTINFVFIKPESLQPIHYASKYHSGRVYYQILDWKSISEWSFRAKKRKEMPCSKKCHKIN